MWSVCLLYNTWLRLQQVQMTPTIYSSGDVTNFRQFIAAVVVGEDDGRQSHPSPLTPMYETLNNEVQSLPSTSLSPLPLPNSGNTCFINSTLQQLMKVMNCFSSSALTSLLDNWKYNQASVFVPFYNHTLSIWQKSRRLPKRQFFHIYYINTKSVYKLFNYGSTFPHLADVHNRYASDNPYVVDWVLRVCSARMVFTLLLRVILW